MTGLRAGDAVFVVADGPVPCAGAGLKPVFLAVDAWRRAGVLADLTVTLVVPWRTINGIPAVDAELDRAARRFGITVLTSTRVRRVDAAARTLHLTGGGAGDGRLRYDLLHLVPRHRPPDWLSESDLARLTDEAGDGLGFTDPVRGMIDVDPATLAHRPTWASGDSATPRTWSPRGPAARCGSRWPSWPTTSPAAGPDAGW